MSFFRGARKPAPYFPRGADMIGWVFDPTTNTAYGECLAWRDAFPDKTMLYILDETKSRVISGIYPDLSRSLFEKTWTTRKLISDFSGHDLQNLICGGTIGRFHALAEDEFMILAMACCPCNFRILVREDYFPSDNSARIDSYLEGYDPPEDAQNSSKLFFLNLGQQYYFCRPEKFLDIVGDSDDDASVELVTINTGGITPPLNAEFTITISSQTGWSFQQAFSAAFMSAEDKEKYGITEDVNMFGVIMDYTNPPIACAIGLDDNGDYERGASIDAPWLQLTRETNGVRIGFIGDYGGKVIALTKADPQNANQPPSGPPNFNQVSGFNTRATQDVKMNLFAGTGNSGGETIDFQTFDVPGGGDALGDVYKIYQITSDICNGVIDSDKSWGLTVLDGDGNPTGERQNARFKVSLT